MKTLSFLTFLALSFTAHAAQKNVDLFKTVFIDNGSVTLKNEYVKNDTIGSYFSRTVYMDTHFEAPQFTCSGPEKKMVCQVLWLSGKYVGLDEKEAALIPKSITDRGAPFLQTTDCGRSIVVELQNNKVTSATLQHEACGGYGGDF